MGGLAGVMNMLVLMLDVATVQTDGCSPLSTASRNGHVEVVRALLEAGADMVSRACSVAGVGTKSAVRRATGALCDTMCVWVGLVMWC